MQRTIDAYNSDPRTLVIVAHPNLAGASRVHRRWAQELEKHPAEFVVHDLYAAIPQAQQGTAAFDEGVTAAERDLVVRHKTVVYQFPVYWYSCPALLRTWVDSVYGFGWAYGGEGALAREAGRELAGKLFSLAMSAGEEEASYRAGGAVGFTVDEVLAPFRATANYVGARSAPHAFALFGTEKGRLSDERLGKSATSYLAWLRGL